MTAAVRSPGKSWTILELLRWTTEQGICDYPECAALGEEFVREHPRHPFYQIKMATNPSPR